MDKLTPRVNRVWLRSSPSTWVTFPTAISCVPSGEVSIWLVPTLPESQLLVGVKVVSTAPVSTTIAVRGPSAYASRAVAWIAVAGSVESPSLFLWLESSATMSLAGIGRANR